MTETQKANAIRLLEKDCQIAGRYIDYNGRTCALGCLALAAGVSKSMLREVNRFGIYGADFIAEKIRSVFGLDLTEQEEIQYRNDGLDREDPGLREDVDERRKRVVDYVKTL